jgi:hypothetical protein
MVGKFLIVSGCTYLEGFAQLFRVSFQPFYQSVFYQQYVIQLILADIVEFFGCDLMVKVHEPIAIFGSS